MLPGMYQTSNLSRLSLVTRAVESESEGFSTWGVGVAENFNDSGSGKTFCSPGVTVCATNVRMRHTWQFKQLDASTKDDHVYSDRRRALTCIPSLRGHSRSAVSLGLITQPTLWECNRSGFVSLKFPFAHSGWHYRCSVTLATQQWMGVLMGARPLLRKVRHRTMITPVNPPRLRLIHISPSYQTVYRFLKLFSNGYCPLDWNSNPMFYANPLLQKNIQSDIN